MAHGTIKKIVAERGFGFIADEGGKDYFFHRDSLVSPLTFAALVGGEAVTFEIQDDPKGKRAVQVTAA